MNGFPVINVDKTSQNIRDIMSDKNFTIASLSRRLGYETYHTVSGWVHGRTVPKIDSLIALASVFEMPIEEIVAVDWVDR